MTVERPGDAEAVARRAADLIERHARTAIAERGLFAVAFSGGRTPAATLSELSTRNLPWTRVHVFQVDERVAPDGHPDRNAGLLQELAGRTDLPAVNLHLVPVADRTPDDGARAYGDVLGEICGVPPVLDLVQLGLGDDGHTASLIPGDPVLDVRDRDVAATGPYQSRRRVTLTFQAIARSRSILWIVTGSGKAEAVRRMVAGDRSIPAGRVRADRATLLVDSEAGLSV